MSTDGATAPVAGPTAGADFDLDRPWRLDDRVAVRPESFGALMYHFGTRKLSFLTAPTLLTVVRSLAGRPNARAACAAAGVPAGALPSYRRALAALADSQMIVTDASAPAARGPAAATAPPVTGTAPERATAREFGGSASGRSGRGLADRFEYGLSAPICLTWELTYACNLACVHCLSSSGRRDPRELTTAECEAVVDTLERMGVFYVNVGGGEPTVRGDFWHLVDYATAHHVGVKFSTNGVRIDAAAARRLAATDYVDVQISLDGATAAVNDAVRGEGSHQTALRAMEHLAAAGMTGFKLSVVVTRHNVPQLDQFAALADRYGAQLRLTRLRPSGRGADTWHELHPTADQQRQLHAWLLAHGEEVLTGDSFFHLSPFGAPLPGLNLCGAGRVVCLIDPVGDVYACPFAIHDQFLAGNVRGPGGFEAVWREAELLRDLRQPTSGGACSSCGSFDSCRGGCMAAKFFTGLPLDGPDPECARGHGEQALHAVSAGTAPRPARDHSHRGRRRRQAPLPVVIGRRPPDAAVAGLPTAAPALARSTEPARGDVCRGDGPVATPPPVRPCAEHPLATVVR